MLCLIGGALLATDAVQERMLRIAGRSFYGAEIRVLAPSFLGEFRAERVEVFDPHSDGSEPTVRLDDLSVTYSLVPGGSGLVQAVRAARLSLRVDLRDSESSNEQWLRELWDARSDESESVPPPKVEIETVVVAMFGPGGSVELEWNGLFVEPTSAGGWRLDVESENVFGRFDLKLLEEPVQIRDAVAKIHVEQRNPGLRGDFSVDVPQLFRAEGGLGDIGSDMSPDADDRVLMHLDSLVLFGEQVPLIAPLPLAFDSIELDRGVLKPSKHDDFGMTFEFEGRARALHAGEVGNEFYSGDVGFSGQIQGGRSLAGDLKLSLDDGQKIGIGFERTPDRGSHKFHAVVTATDLLTAPWIRYAAGDEIDGLKTGRVNGYVTLHQDPGEETMHLSPELVLASASYHGFEVQEVTLAGTATWLSGARLLEIRELVAAARDGVNRVTMADAEIVIEPMRAHGTFDATVDLASLGAAIEFEDLWGEARVTGSLDIDEDQIVVPFEIVSEVAGYGDWVTPYQMPLAGEGRVEYALPESQGTLNDVEFRLGSGTRMHFREWSFATSNQETSGRVELVSDLDAVVAMGMLDSASGTIEASWSFAYGDESLSGPWTLEADVGALVLTEQAASLSGLTSNLSGSWAKGLQGSGELRAISLSVAGGEAHDIFGDVRIDDSVLRMPDLSAGLFDGMLTADIALRLAEEDFPVTLHAELYDMDFERFTKEVQPPSLEMTGRARGHLDLEYTLAGLQRFLLTITSDEDLSVNRGLIKDALRADTLRETLGERRLRKTMDTLLGTAPQRPFDSGELIVRLDAEQFVGNVRLESIKTRDYNGLNLNVELKIDLPALVSTLKLLEQSAGGAVDF